MQPVHFVRILTLSLALAGYSAWVLALKPPPVVDVPADGGSKGVRLIRLAEAEILWYDPGTLFVDVRSLTDYEFGHIAGAVHLPESQFEHDYPPLQQRLQRARIIVVYCKSVDCGLSLWAAIRLRQEGLAQTVIFPEGWNVWVNRGLPVFRMRS